MAGAVPHGGYDGARLRYDRWDRAVLVWLRERSAALREDRGHVPSVLGAAVLAASLRLRHARRQIRAHRRREPQGQRHMYMENI